MKNIKYSFPNFLIVYLVGFITTLSGIIVLIGWQLDIYTFKTFGLSSITMKPNAAILFIVSGLTMVILQYSHPITKFITRTFSLLILIIGILTITEFSFHLNYGIDELFYKVSDTTGFASSPGRMAVNAALSFILISIVFLFLSFWPARSNFFIEFCLIAMFSISGVGFLGYVFGLSNAVGVTKYSRMAVNTAVLFILLFFGLFSIFRHRFGFKITIEQKFFAGLTSTIVVFLFILLLLLANTRMMYEAGDSVQKTEKVKLEIQKIDRVISKVSTSILGYLFTGNENYLNHYQRSAKEIAIEIKNLRDLFLTNTNQLEKIKTLDSLIRNQTELSKMMVNAMKVANSEKEERLMEIARKNEEISEKILNITSRMIREEDEQLRLLNASENYRSRQVMIAVKVGFLFQIFLLTLIFILVRKDVMGRRKKEAILHKLNEVLEDRVMERTLALQKSERKYRTIFENIQDVFFQTNLNGIVLEMSPSIKNSTEYERDEIIGSHVNRLYFNANDRTELLDNIMKTGEIRDYEVSLRTKTNEIRFVSINALLIHDSNSNSDHIDGIARDITQRKKSENQLQLLSWAIDQSPITIVITDKNGSIEYVNPKFSEVTGYAAEEVLGQNVRILQSGYHSKAFYEGLWFTILEGKEWRGEIYNKKKNGELYWENTIISNVKNLKGNITSFISIREDITERKKMMEDLLKTKKQAEESNNLKAAFLSNISHEIRTPFTAILGFLSAFQDEGLTSNERAEYIGIINKSAYMLMKTINDIADMSQIQAGQAEVIPSEINLELLIEELRERMLTEIENKGVQFIINYDIGRNKRISTDKKKLNDILDILINNAIKFTSEGSIELSVKRFNNYLRFMVKDTGIGISKNKLQEIFEPFRQADNSATRKFDGLGLGLSIAKAYVELLGGTILIESEEGIGSTFSFDLFCPIEKRNHEIN